MSRGASPLRDRMIFAFGAQRSGTWWLQRMLTAHRLVSAVPSETYLFTGGIKPLFDRFHHGLRSSPVVGQLHVERGVLLDATRDFCDAVLGAHLDPGARYLSERSPGHAKAVDVIREVYPDARLIHIIRDGRDVARSLAARDWGPATVGEAAREWRESIEQARAAAPAERYLEVRYEELLADPEAGIVALYAWLGLPADDEDVRRALAASRWVLNEDPKDPRAAHGKWRDHFTAADLAAFEAEAGRLLAQLGYADGDRPVPVAASRPPRRPMAAGLRRRAAAWTSRATTGPPEASRDETSGALAPVQATADAILAGLHAGGDVASHLAPDIVLRVIGPDGERRLAGVQDATRVLAGDPAWRGRQLRGENHPGVPNYSLVMVYELGDGSRAVRVLQMIVRAGLVEAMTVYQLALGAGERAAGSG